jgi:hypothetical protein
MDTRIQTRVEMRKRMWGLGEGGGVAAAASGKEERKTEWPIRPALSLEHVAADEAKVKGGKKNTTRTSWSTSLALEGLGASVFKRCRSLI